MYLTKLVYNLERTSKHPSKIIFPTGLIKASPLENWRETLAAIFAHAGSDEITDLCDALARHLFSHGQYHAAILSWICAGNVDQTVRAWTQTLKQKAPEGDNLQVTNSSRNATDFSLIYWVK